MSVQGGNDALGSEFHGNLDDFEPVRGKALLDPIAHFTAVFVDEEGKKSHDFELLGPRQILEIVNAGRGPEDTVEYRRIQLEDDDASFLRHLFRKAPPGRQGQCVHRTTPRPSVVVDLVAMNPFLYLAGDGLFHAHALAEHDGTSQKNTEILHGLCFKTRYGSAAVLIHVESLSCFGSGGPEETLEILSHGFRGFFLQRDKFGGR